MGSQGGYSARSLMGGVDGLTQCWFLHRVSEANCSVSQSDQQSPVSSPYLTPLHYVQMALCRRHPRRSVFLPLCARLAGPGGGQVRTTGAVPALQQPWPVVN